MKIVTFNARTDRPEDGINNIKYRLPYIKAKIEQEKPDVVGFQELKMHTGEDFKQMLPDYYILGFGRTAEYAGEKTPIAVRKDSFDILEMGGCWLSDTPNVPGSRFEGQSSCPRVLIWVKLLDFKTGKIIRVYNAHLDHIEVPDYEPRKREFHQILGIIDEDMKKEKLPFIFMGDFNTEPHNSETAEIDARKDMIDFTTSIGPTYHGFGDPSQYVKIDYIYGTTDWEVSKVGTWEDCYDGVWLSDHYPVFIDAELK